MFTDHKSSLDNMSHSQIRVVLEHLLMTMDIKQRNKFKDTFPGLYKMIYPNVIAEDWRVNPSTHPSLYPHRMASKLTDEEYKMIYPGS